MSHDGYLDRLFVHKDFQGQGIATALVDVLERDAATLGLTEIRTDASITAKPFFEQRGFRTIRQQSVERRGVSLTNYQMAKKLLH